MNILTSLTMYKAIKNEIANKEKELEEIKNAILEYMNGKNEIIIGQYKATNKEIIREGIDEKALKTLYPEIAEELKKTTVYNRFTVK